MLWIRYLRIVVDRNWQKEKSMCNLQKAYNSKDLNFLAIIYIFRTKKRVTGKSRPRKIKTKTKPNQLIKLINYRVESFRNRDLFRIYVTQHAVFPARIRSRREVSIQVLGSRGLFRQTMKHRSRVQTPSGALVSLYEKSESVSKRAERHEQYTESDNNNVKRWGEWREERCAQENPRNRLKEKKKILDRSPRPKDLCIQ